MVNHMDCIVLLLLLSCCGGFGGGNNRSGNNNCGSTFSQNDGYGRGNASPLRNANNIGNNFSPRNNDCDCQESASEARNSNDCGPDGNVRSFSGQNPSSWQDFPEISRRDNDNNCDCEN